MFFLFVLRKHLCGYAFFFILTLCLYMSLGVYWAPAVNIVISMFAVLLSCSRTPGVSYCLTLLQVLWLGLGHVCDLTTQHGHAHMLITLGSFLFSILVLYLYVFCVHLPGVPSVSFCPARCSSSFITIVTKASLLRSLAHIDISVLWILTVALQDNIWITGIPLMNFFDS